MRPLLVTIPEHKVSRMRRIQSKKTHSSTRPRRAHHRQERASSPYRPTPLPRTGAERYWILSFSKGLEHFVTEELRKHRCQPLATPQSDEEAMIRGREQLGRELQSVRTATALFRAVTLPVERPRGITSYEHEATLRSLFEEVFHLTPRKRFSALRLEGAGKHTPTFQRLGDYFARMTNLPYRPDDEDADLVIRLRRSAINPGWEVLVRTTTRPLATRQWRVKQMRGAVSGPIAAALVQLARPSSDETVLNIPCGSGTILAELLESTEVHSAIGLDLDEATLEAARHNLATWIHRPTLQLLQADMRRIPLADNTASVIISDPPWGEALGTRSQVSHLYLSMLKEMHRLLSPRGRLIIITQHHRALEHAAAPLFTTERSLQVSQGGFQPRILIYRKRHDGA